MKRAICIVLLLFVSTVSANEKRLRFDNLSVNDGLSSSTVYSICQDSIGYLWFGTANGLNRFDGYRFKTYKTRPIRAMLVDRTGKLWIGTGRGLHYFDPKDDSLYIPRLEGDTANLLSRSIIYSLHESDNGELFIGTKFGLYKYDPEKKILRTYNLPPAEDKNRNISRKIIVNIFEGKDDKLWVCTHDGLLLLDPDSGDAEVFNGRSQYPYDPISNLILSVMPDQDDDSVLWVGSETGLHMFDLRTKSHTTFRVEQDAGLSNNVIRCIVPFDNDSFLIATDRGLNLFNKNSHKVVTYLHNSSDALSIPSNGIENIFRDSNGVVWLATQNGVSRISPYSESIRIVDFKSYIDRDSGDGEAAQMLLTASGEQWLYIADRMMSIPHNSSKVLQFESSSQITNIRNIFVDKEGVVWVGSNNGLWYLDRSKNSFCSALKIFGDHDFISDIAEDALGNIWITGIGSIYRLQKKYDSRGNISKIISKRISFPNVSYAILSLFVDRFGYVWAAERYDKLLKYDSKTEQFEKYDSDNSRGLNNFRVNFFFEYGTDTLCIVTNSGIYKYNYESNLFVEVSTSNKLDYSKILSCRIDSKNNVWMLTETQLVRMLPSGSLNFWGIESIALDEKPVKDALYIDQDDMLWVGYKSGWLIIDPEKLPITPQGHSLQITNVDILDEKSNWNSIAFNSNSSLCLGHRENNLRISFSQMNNMVGGNSYSYKMQGVDQEWSGGNNSFASYIDLTPGSYLFEVHPNDGLKVDSKDVKSLRVIISPPWYNSKIAWLSYIILLTSVILYIWRVVHLHIKRLLRKQAEQHKYNLEHMTGISKTTLPSQSDSGSLVLNAENSIAESDIVKIDPFLLQIVEIINVEIHNEDLDIPLLCEKLHVTHKTLYRRIKSLTGLNIRDFIRHVRLKEAARLLIESDKSIAEISFEVGFSYNSYFSKCFVNHYSLSPKEYRKKHVDNSYG